jgi:hypothetical protein
VFLGLDTVAFSKFSTKSSFKRKSMRQEPRVVLRQSLYQPSGGHSFDDLLAVEWHFDISSVRD